MGWIPTQSVSSKPNWSRGEITNCCLTDRTTDTGNLLDSAILVLSDTTHQVQALERLFYATGKLTTANVRSVTGLCVYVHLRLGAP